MGEFLGIENSALKFVIAFVLVMALIGLTAWLIRQFSSARPNSSSGARNRQPRLAVLDSAVVDARRRLVLIRRDNVEHLLMIGGPTDVVVEANVVRAQSAAAPQPVAPPRAAPQRAPNEPIEPDYDPSLVPFDEPYYEEPAPRPAPRERPAPAMRAPAPVAAPSPAPRVAAPRPAPMVEPRVAPAPAAPPRQTQYTDMAQRLEAALRAPAVDTPARPAPEPRIAPNAPSFAAREEPQLAPPPAASEPEPKPAGDVFSSLEEEMANLLKPSGGKDSA
jgi:flagellar biogenesis protein FliO